MNQRVSEPPAIMVPVSDALEYGQHLTAGFDNLLIELGAELANGLPADLSDWQRRAICRHVGERIAAARAGVEEAA